MLTKMRFYFYAFILSAFLVPAIGYGRQYTTRENVFDGIAIIAFVALGIFIMRDANQRRNRFFRVLAAASLICLPCCATMEGSALFGATMGAAAGTGTGILIESSPGSALIGAGIGAVLGAGAGYLLHREPKKEPITSPAAKRVSESEVPALLPPEASCSRTDGRIEGSRYYGPQIQCDIEKAATWGR